MKRNDIFVDSLCRFGYDRGMQVEITPEETTVLVGWKKRSGSRVLAGMKAEAVLYASRGVDVGIIAETVERTERTVQEWPTEWWATRMRRVLTGHAGNQNAAEPARTRKQELKAILARPPSRTGARAGFWDVPALREVVKILFDAEHQSDSSYRLLLRLCGPNPEPPGACGAPEDLELPEPNPGAAEAFRLRLLLLLVGSCSWGSRPEPKALGIPLKRKSFTVCLLPCRVPGPGDLEP